MAWEDYSTISLYHGTDRVAAEHIQRNGVDWKFGRPLTDFGVGFYTTTSVRLARGSARSKAVMRRSEGVVIEFRMSVEQLVDCASISFVRRTDQFWKFVETFRYGDVLHFPPLSRNFDVVVGPITLSAPRTMIKRIMRDGDQFSFHSDKCNHLLALHTLRSI